MYMNSQRFAQFLPHVHRLWPWSEIALTWRHGEYQEDGEERESFVVGWGETRSWFAWYEYHAGDDNGGPVTEDKGEIEQIAFNLLSALFCGADQPEGFTFRSAGSCVQTMDGRIANRKPTAVV